MRVRLDGNRTQLLLVGVVPLIFLLALSIAGALLVYETDRVTSLSRISTALLAQSSSLAQAVQMGDRALSDYQAGYTTLGLYEYRLATAAIHSRARVLLGLVPRSSPDRAEAARYVNLANSGVGVLSQYLAYLRAGKLATARQYARSPTVQRISKELAAAESRFNAREQATTISLFDSLSKEVRSYSKVVFWICIAGLLATLLTVGGLGQAAQRLHEALRQRKELSEAYRREHHVVSTLQRTLLPLELPVFPGVRIDAAYAPAAKGADIGGDWYDVFALSDRTIAVGVGDVLGHDLYAATVMASARQAIRIAAREDPNPAHVLERVNRFLCLEEARMATAFFGTFDLVDGTLSYATAGHPSPIVVRSDRSIALLDGRGLMLGVNPRAVFTTHKEQLGVGCALVLYTDGLIEIQRNYTEGVTRLEAAVLSAVFSASENIAEAIQKRVFSGIEPEDDSATLFLGITELGERVDSKRSRTWNVNARDEVSARRTKRALLGYLGEFASKDSDFEATEMIVGELLSNVARHTPGFADIAIEFSKDGVRLNVTDRGKAFSNRGEHIPGVLAESGRGLFIVRTLADDFHIEHAAQGNCISVLLPIRLEKWRPVLEKQNASS